MKNKMDYETTLTIAKKRNPKYNWCIEYANAWAFSADDGEVSTGGPDTGIIILKKDGKLLMSYE